MSHSTSSNPGSQPVQQASLRTPLGRVRGRGAAGHGAHHWWMQRVSSIALTFQHTASGLQVILEDYVNNEALRRGSILLVQGVSWLLGIAAVLAVLRIAV